MRGRRIDVDLGPMALSLLEGGTASVAADAGAREEDALRLRSLLEGRPGPAGDRGARADVDDANSPSGAAGRVAGGHDASGCPALDEANVELLAFELSAALQAMRSGHAGSSAEVRLFLRPTVLRDARLGVVESDGRLEFSLWVGHDEDCQWLVRQLPGLAGALGDRLRKTLRVRVFDGAGQHLEGEHGWPPEAFQ